MTIVKNSFDLESMIEFTRRGVSLDLEETLGNPIASPDTLLDLLTTPGTLIPSIFRQANPDNDLLTDRDFLFCEPLAPLEIQNVQRCDICKKNPIAFVPDWETKENNYIFFNQRECTYSVVVETNVYNIPDETTIKLYISLGVERLLRHYKKSATITAVMYIPTTSNNYDLAKDEIVTNDTGKTLTTKYKAELLSGNVIKNVKGVLEGDALFSIPPAKSGYRRILEDFDSVEQVAPAAEAIFDKIKDIYVSIAPGQRTKLLVNVPVDILDAVPLEVAPESDLKNQFDTSSYETPFEVTISGQDYIDLFTIISRNLKRSSRFMGDLILQGDSGTLYTNTTVLQKDGNYKIVQEPHFVDFESKSNLLLRFEEKYIIPLMNYASIVPQDLESIKINIQKQESNLSLRVSEITYKKYGCDPVKMSDLVDQNPLIADLFSYDDDIVIGYVAKLPSMKMYLEGQEDINWIEFLTKFTYPGLTIKDPEIFVNGEGDDEIVRCMAENTLDSIVEMLMQKFVELPNLFLGGLTRSICNTASDFRNSYNETTKEIGILGDKIRRLEQEANDIRLRRKTLRDKVNEVGLGNGELLKIEKLNEEIAILDKRVSEINKQIGKEFGPEYVALELGEIGTNNINTIRGLELKFNKNTGDINYIDPILMVGGEINSDELFKVAQELGIISSTKPQITTPDTLEQTITNEGDAFSVTFEGTSRVGNNAYDLGYESIRREVIIAKLKELITFAELFNLQDKANVIQKIQDTLKYFEERKLDFDYILSHPTSEFAKEETKKITELYDLIDSADFGRGLRPNGTSIDTSLDSKVLSLNYLKIFLEDVSKITEKRIYDQVLERSVGRYNINFKIRDVLVKPDLYNLFLERESYLLQVKNKTDELKEFSDLAKADISNVDIISNPEFYSINQIKENSNLAMEKIKQLQKDSNTAYSIPRLVIESTDVNKFKYVDSNGAIVETAKAEEQIKTYISDQKSILEQAKIKYESAKNRFLELERLSKLESTSQNVPQRTLESSRSQLEQAEQEYEKQNEIYNNLNSLLYANSEAATAQFTLASIQNIARGSSLPGTYLESTRIDPTVANAITDINKETNKTASSVDVAEIYKRQQQLLELAIKERKQEIKRLKKQFREDKKKYINNFERKGIEFRKSFLTQLDKEQKSEKPLLELILRVIFPTTSSQNKAIGKNKLEGVFKALNGGGGWCAWVQMLLDASECVMKGLGLEDAKQAIIKSLLKSLTPFEFQKLLRNLPAGLREKIRAQLETSVPGLVEGAFPWDYKYPGTGEYSEDEMILEEPTFGLKVPVFKPKQRIKDDFINKLEAESDALFDFAIPKPESFDSKKWYEYLKQGSDYKTKEGFDKLGILDEKIVQFFKDATTANKYLNEYNLYFPIIEVVGHTDPFAGDEYNMQLSLRRAQTIYELLVDSGVDPNILAVVGKGETELKNKDLSVEGGPTEQNIAAHKVNRRVEFKIREESYKNLMSNINAINADIDAYNTEEQDKFKDQKRLYDELKAKYDLDLEAYKINQAALKDPEYQKLLKKAEKERRKQDVANNLKEYQLQNSQNLGRELGNIQKTIIDATIDYLLESVGVNTLFEYLKNMPGMTLALKVVTDLKCLIPPIPNMDPKWDNFLKTTKFNICHFSKKFGRADITMPKMRNNKKLRAATSGEGDPTQDLAQVSVPKPRVKDLFLVLSKKISDMILDLATQLLVKIIVSLVEKTLDLLCNLVGDLAANLVSLFQQNNDVKEQLKNALCPEDVSDEQFANGMKNILDGLYKNDPSRKDCVSSLTNQDLLAYIESLLIVLNYGQIYDLLSGNATQNVLEISSKIAKSSPSESIRCIFSNPDSVGSYFKGIGLLTNIRDVLQAFPDNLQLTEFASVCPPNTIDSLNNFRTNILSNRGLTNEQIQDQLNLYKNMAQKKLEDLFNYMQNNPLDELLDMLYPNDTNCPTNALVIAEPDVDFAVDQELEAVFTPLESELERDLIGPHGVMQHVLSDTNGKKYSIHRFLVDYFGSPLGEMARGVSFYSDNMIIASDNLDLESLGLSDLEDKEINEVLGNSFFMSSKKRDRIDSLGNRVFAADQEGIFTAPGGGFPLTVGGHLLRKLQNNKIGYSINKETLVDDELPEISFKTRKVTIQDKFLREQEVSYNKVISDMRKEYVAKFALVSGMVLAEVAAPYISEQLDEYTLRSPFTRYRKTNETRLVQNNLLFEQMIAACDNPTLYNPLEIKPRKFGPEFYVKKLFSYVHAAERYVDVPVLYVENNGVTDSETRFGINGSWLIDVVAAEGFKAKQVTNFGYGKEIYNVGDEYMKNKLSDYGTFRFNGSVSNVYSDVNKLPSESRELYDLWNTLIYGTFYNIETGELIEGSSRSKRDPTDIIKNELSQLARFTKEVAFPYVSAYAANTEASQTGIKENKDAKETEEEKLIRIIFERYGSNTWTRKTVNLRNIQEAYDPVSKQQIIQGADLSKDSTDLQVLDFLNKQYGSEENVNLRTPLSPLTDINPFELGFSYMSYRKPLGIFQGNKRELAAPDYAFDLTYDFNMQNTGSLELDPEKKNKYRVVLTEITNPLNDERLQNLNNSNYRDYYKVAKNLSYLDEASAESLQPPLVVIGGSYRKNQIIKFDKEIESVPSEEVGEYIKFLETKVNDNTVTYSYELESFIRYMIDKLDFDITKSGAIANNIIKERMLDFDSKQELKNFFDNINEGFARRISNRIGFSDKSPEITFEENQYRVVPNDKDFNFLEKQGATDSYKKDLEKVKNALGSQPLEVGSDSLLNTGKETVYIPNGFRFGWDLNVEPQIQFLDPLAFGSPENRNPFYIKPPAYKGWLGMLQLIIPEGDACEPARIPLNSFEDIKASVQEIRGQFKKDNRLNFDPFCTKESPYDKMQDPADLAMMDAIIKATCRTYILETALRIVPIISEFRLSSKDNFDELLEIYISERMLDFIKTMDAKRRFKAKGRKVLRDENTGRLSVTSEKYPMLTYYYGMLEQAVSLIIKKVDAGILDINTLSITQVNALNKIRSKIEEYYLLYGGTEATLTDEAIQAQTFFNKVINKNSIRDMSSVSANYVTLGAFNKLRAKRIKQSISYMTLLETEEEAKTLFSVYIKEQFDSLSTILDDKLKPKVQNIDYLFMSDPNFINGAVSFQRNQISGDLEAVGGPYDVMADVLKPETFGIDMSKFTDDSVKQYSEESEYRWPFVLESYIMVNDKKETDLPNLDVSNTILNRESNLFKIVNLKEWDKFVKNIISKDFTNGEYKISELFGPGVTVKDEDPESPTFGEQVVKDTGLKFGLRISMLFDESELTSGTIFGNPIADVTSFVNEKDVQENKAYRLNRTKPDGTNETLRLVPFVNAELDVKDQKLREFSITQYDLICLINKLIKSKEFKTLFRYVFPYRRYLSLMSVYVANSFFDSIGNMGTLSEGGDKWTVPGGRRGSSFRKWDKEYIFDNPERTFHGGVGRELMTTFLSYYKKIDEYENQTQRNKRTNRFQTENITKELMDLIPKDFLDSLPWWMRRNRVDRPYDMFDNECPEFDDLDPGEPF